MLLGSNDSANNEMQHVPLDEYKDNLRQIVQSILNYGLNKENLIIITPPKIEDELWSKHSIGPSSHFDHLVKNYANYCFSLCKELDLKCVDLYNLMNNSTDYGKYLFDGLHLSPLGGKLLFDHLSPIIEELFIKNDKLEFNFPYWKEIENRVDVKNIPQFKESKY